MAACPKLLQVCIASSLLTVCAYSQHSQLNAAGFGRGGMFGQPAGGVASTTRPGAPGTHYTTATASVQATM